jgi:hypothetical protein
MGRLACERETQNGQKIGTILGVNTTRDLARWTLPVGCANVFRELFLNDGVCETDGPTSGARVPTMGARERIQFVLMAASER